MLGAKLLALDANDAKLLFFFSQYIQRLGRGLRARQRTVRAAMRLLRAYYRPYPERLRSHDPLLYAALALWIASKEEENPLSVRDLVKHMRAVAPRDGFNSPYQEVDLVETEPAMLDALAFHLGHGAPPERELACYLEAARVGDLFDPTQLIANATYLLNDLYRTDAPLLHPPHLLALCCIWMAAGCLGITLPESLGTLVLGAEHEMHEIADMLAHSYESALALNAEPRSHLHALQRQLDSHFPRRRPEAVEG